MKRWIAFIILSAISTLPSAFGCGFYPYGEDVRFHLLEPRAFGYTDLDFYGFTSGRYAYLPEGSEVPLKDTGFDGNIHLWAAYCRGNAPLTEVEQAVYQAGVIDVETASSTNAMIRYLHRTHDTAAIQYLVFAKKCESLNAFFGDPWERTDALQLPQRAALIREALAFAEKEQKAILQSRYAFLAIRLAYYNNDSKTLTDVWQQYFAKRKAKNTIDYWAMHFRAMTEDGNEALRNFYAAQVFYHAPEKRFAIYERYYRDVPVENTLRLAATAEERAAVWLMAGLHNPGKAIAAIEALNKNAPHSPALSFLLLRELSKLEDWIYTPTYTYFNPTLDTARQYNAPVTNSLRNVPGDRRYAASLLRFVTSGDANIRDNPALWNIAAGYLYSMTGSHSSATARFDAAIHTGNTSVQRQAAILRAVCLTTRQKGGAVIPGSIKGLLMSEQARGNNRFLFAVGRELEMKGDVVDAALLYSRMSDHTSRWQGQQPVYWRSPAGRRSLHDDYFDDYFYYLDAQYTPVQVQAVINATAHARDTFSRWALQTLRPDYPRLLDMLGTKYIRENDLSTALAVFSRVPDTLYTSELYGYKVYLAANPFYTNLYNEHRPTVADTARFTKAGITRRLMQYLQKAESRGAPDRDHYYFLVANCYLNMTQWGNSWMMRRYYWSGSQEYTRLEDDDEYFGAHLAQQYYLRAKAYAKNPIFAALCLRMAGRCEKYRLMYSMADGRRYGNEYNDELFSRNKYWAQLKQQYPQYYDELISNCTVFEQYYSAGR